ncbi:hypothetical protein ES708_16673 [subsurface metagenome]
MGKNVIREALNILHNRRSDEMTAEEIHLVDTVLAFTANELPKVFPEFEGMKLSRILQVTQNIRASHNIRVTQKGRAGHGGPQRGCSPSGEEATMPKIL